MDAFKEFVKVNLTKVFAMFKPFIVQYKALDNELPEGFGGPDAELGGLIAVYPVAYGYDGIEIEKV